MPRMIPTQTGVNSTPLDQGCQRFHGGAKGRGGEGAALWSVPPERLDVFPIRRRERGGGRCRPEGPHVV